MHGMDNKIIDQGMNIRVGQAHVSPQSTDCDCCVNTNLQILDSKALQQKCSGIRVGRLSKKINCTNFRFFGPALPYQTLTNTNTWRTPGDERGAPGKHTVFATERFGAE